MTIDFQTVTELAGTEITQEQLERLYHRYYWAGKFCKDKDVVETACGVAPGIGYLATLAKSIVAGDYSEKILQIARQHYETRFDLKQFDAQAMPLEDNSKDIVLLFEAIYYLPLAEKFVSECRRVLRNSGKVLIVTTNKDITAFNPSPFTHTYYGVVEIKELFERYGFTIACFGYSSIKEVSIRQKILQPVKWLAVHLNLIPKTMDGKKFLKRIVFGKLTQMPPEIKEGMMPYKEPISLPTDQPDREYKVIYCIASLASQKD